MASWGNETGTQHQQDMESNGYKLKVTGNTGGTGYQAEFKDEGGFGQAVKVDGALHLYRDTVLQGRIQPNLLGAPPVVQPDRKCYHGAECRDSR